VAGVVTLASNAARFGSAFNFGPGYQSSLSWNTRVLLELVGSWSSGLLWFAPLALWGVVTLVRRARGGDSSVRLALVLVGSTLLSAVLIHPNRNTDLLQQWIGWSGGVRFALPALGILIASIPEPRRFASRLALASAALVGFVWNLSMLLVPYNAQERIAPVAGFHPPQPWRQWSLVPTAWHNTWHLIVTGSTSRHSSAFFLSFWQVGALRQYGRVTLLLTLPLSAGLLVGGVLVLRRAARDEA